MMMLRQLQRELIAMGDPQIASHSQKFFKTAPGEYGAGDIFLGVRVAKVRAVAKKYYTELSLRQTLRLLSSKYHEQRLCALVILTLKFQKGPESREVIYQAYCKSFRYINNWDLVDLSAHKIVGEYLADRSRRPLHLWAKSEDLWTRRIAIIATFALIRRGELADSFELAKNLLFDQQDLMHKAVGWVLRECGKKDQKALIKFIEEHGERMPRTMLRYAIEKLPESRRKKILKIKFKAIKNVSN
jgi:3-methyladenine DNA glycosylase AlkD